MVKLRDLLALLEVNRDKLLEAFRAADTEADLACAARDAAHEKFEAAVKLVEKLEQYLQITGEEEVQS